MRTAIALLLLLAAPVFAQDDITPKVDAIFANYAKNDAPGCAAGVARNGQILLERGYGMANLEHDIPITPNTIFEAGSVSKQFTAAAVLLLVQDGKLSLDDKVRKYLPELDASAADITIRQMLNHTSGLRDWGSVVSLEGWRRGTRRHTMAHVLDVISRQRSLNFAPGTKFSYSNSGYNLAAIVVERVSGKTFPEFTRERIFVPMGMTHSGWRDNHLRIVKGRATAYDPVREGGYIANMDSENIYGNCCLLTTVGDLLRWTPRADQMTSSVLAGGQTIDYALGLFTDTDRNEIFHGGATAGWRAFYGRRLEDGFTVAVLCNRGDAAAGSLSEKVTSLFVKLPEQTAPPPLPANAASLAGLYRDPETNAVMRVFVKDDRLRIGYRATGGGALVPISGNRYRLGARGEVEFDEKGLRLNTSRKPAARYVRVAEATPRNLSEYAGEYTSDEARATYEIVVDGNQLVAKMKPGLAFKLDPTYTDGFMSEGGDLVHFTRDAKGRVNGVDIKADFSVGEGTARVERMHFSRK